MNGDEQVEHVQESVPTADSPKPAATGGEPPASPESAAASSPGSTQDEAGSQDQRSAAERLRDQLTATEEAPAPDEDLQGIDDPEGLLQPTEFERQAMSERNRKRWDKMRGLYGEERRRASDLEKQMAEQQALADLGKRVSEGLGGAELDEEARGLVKLAQLAEADPAQALAAAQQWMEALLADHPELAGARPTAGLRLYEGALTPEEQEAIDYGLVSEEVIRRGRVAEAPPAAVEQQEQAEEKPETPEKPAAAKPETPAADEPTAEDISTGRAIATVLMAAEVPPQAVTETFEQLLPIITELIDAEPQRYPLQQVPNAAKPRLALKALSILRERAAAAATPPPVPEQPGRPVKRGGMPSVQPEKPLPGHNDEANQLFKELTGQAKAS
jgi:hypothetical protein